MPLVVPELLGVSELEEIRTSIPDLDWRDGAETAGSAARAVKRNEQAHLSKGQGGALQLKLRTFILNHPVISAAAIPYRLTPLIISRTALGGGYGPHTDNAWIGSGEHAVRSDLSFTLFLSDPETYEGGELIVETQSATEAFKLKAGHILIYPSSLVHQVAEVTAGVRYVAIGWIESRIQDEMARSLLFDLANLQAAFESKYAQGSAEMLTLTKVRNALLKRFSTGR